MGSFCCNTYKTWDNKLVFSGTRYKPCASKGHKIKPKQVTSTSHNMNNSVVISCRESTMQPYKPGQRLSTRCKGTIEPRPLPTSWKSNSMDDPPPPYFLQSPPTPVANPTNSSDEAPETVYADFWPDLRKYIESNGRSESGEWPRTAVCGLCLNAELDILGLSPSSEATSSIKPAVTTICGHMACRPCIDSWYQARCSEDKPPTCPFCRHEMRFHDCAHRILGFRIPTNNEIYSGVSSLNSYLSDVPLTLPEGEKSPGRCNDCDGGIVVKKNSVRTWSYIWGAQQTPPPQNHDDEKGSSGASELGSAMRSFILMSACPMVINFSKYFKYR